MFKKIIALTLIFAMLVPFTAAAAADELSESRSMEEILDEYHRRAFEAQAQGNTRSASPNSRSGGKTLEEETVDALTEAGYEAYNVTAGNYDTMEAQLQTDFAAMGLDPEGSYIIVIHGEPEGSETNGNSRLIDPPTEEDFGDGGSSFVYVYDNVAYSMRYVTVTAGQNSELGRISGVDLQTELNAGNVLEILDSSISIVSILESILPWEAVFSSYPPVFAVGSLLTLINTAFPEVQPTYHDLLEYTGATSWVVTYTQIYDYGEQEWFTRASVEYATMQYFIDYHYYDRYRGQYVKYSADGIYGTQYSTHYNDTEHMKECAVVAYRDYNGIHRNKIKSVEYKFGGTVVLIHPRWTEGLGYEPLE